MILFAAGDIGGARALLPVITTCVGRGLPCTVVAHGHLVREVPTAYPMTSLPETMTTTAIASLFEKVGVTILVFASSVHDTTALTLARHAKNLKIPVIHILDNWSNYRHRLAHDHLPMLVPDIYAVMDEEALQGALAEGIPAATLRITGQPALASLADELTGCSPPPPASGPIRLVFVSEPVAADQGENATSPGYRGYTETMVLRYLCQALQPMADKVYLSILPHPREGRSSLKDSWQAVRGKVQGEILSAGDGRHQILTAEGVIGMASLLLYEAWLAGIPVLSLQPGLRLDALRTIARRSGLSFVDAHEKIAKTLSDWLPSVRQSTRMSRPDLGIHREAAARITTLIETIHAERLSEHHCPEREKK